ncbi:flagellin [Sphingomonas sp. TDK1]|uniref:flagellin n=1 Tax=Sphingomonas sp. TDK1 TaxID=453247 RepID=UPI0007D9F7CF|nr:flagellin [Sphingomonas sp. TDK1]OAN57410.1 flagellin [Sphingomonas sp. TDK1]
MAFSVNTNVGAMAALQSLNATNKELATTQSRINTGLEVSSTKDDSARYTIASKLRGDVGTMKAVTSSLNRAKSTTDVAVAGAEQIQDLVNQMSSKTKEAQDAGLDQTSRDSVAKDLTSLKTQVNSIIDSSEFNGVNLLKAPAASTTVGSVSALMSTKSTSASDTINVANQATDTDFATAAGTKGAAIALANAGAADTLQTALGTFSDKVKTTLSNLGAASRQLDGQLQFTSKLSDVVEAGIGNLVDADLAKESARLQAAQVKQQLGVQALSIANQAPQTITSLFR